MNDQRVARNVGELNNGRAGHDPNRGLAVLVAVAAVVDVTESDDRISNAGVIQLGAGGVDIRAERGGAGDIDIHGSRHEGRSTGSQAERQSEEHFVFHDCYFVLVNLVNIVG